ncbi:LytTR family DNA-binding domain-containing protein [Gilvimarinus sp. SDUM040013]|uniref:LytTR family DNA-binding domain-containing protein n=1 Tax=Gilvimarinus gilvus TaxID=3058038 RepID=A0ABU4S2N7_9GAMM|nr:LytTR family DNA-binding domain-containing protein [Gilvimarinus sp. SDUM040013]MDO3384391.1 LytTR family DNA-binding domain-containing protein [Gilvimarinus sp. SDUM040013]MDX6851442.1 LytTR family DNA-binding domain-containing protein [Gilvimarinus sp. SDUM040013]
MLQRTILGLAPIQNSLLGTGVVLTVLFTVSRPEASAGLGALARLLFWSAHIGTALLAILVVSALIRRFNPTRWPLWWLVVSLGLFGCLLSAPVYWLLELGFAPHLEHSEPDGYWDVLGARGPWHGIAAEAVEAMPQFMVCWIAINLPLLFARPTVYGDGGGDNPSDPEPTSDTEQEMKQRRDQFFDSLPEVIGTDIVAISSDLHYLNVYTELGQAMVLGSLKNIAEAFGEEGVQLHRSHWVMKKQVKKVCISREDAYCLTHTGQRVPISRANRKLAKALFGQLNHSAVALQGAVSANAAAPLKRVQ